VHGRQRTAQRVRVGRDEDQMHMVGHQHPGPDLNGGRRGVLGQQVPIEPVVVVAKEGLRATVAALGDVVRDAGEHRAG